MLRWLPLLLISACAPLGASRAPSTEAEPEIRYSPASSPESSRAKAQADRLDLFDGLVAAVRATNRFSPNTAENLSPLTFEAALPALREAFAAASTDAELADALERFGNSLHDARAGYRPAAEPVAHETLPLVIEPEWSGHNLAMVVTASKLKGVEPGDRVTSYDGTPTEALLRTYADRSPASDWHGVARDVAAWLTRRPTERVDGGDLGAVALGIRRHDGTDARVSAAWALDGWHGDAITEPKTPSYEAASCEAQLPVRKYPTYELAGHGRTFCVYTSKAPRYAPFPIVRLFSFEFGGAFAAEADYDHLARMLRGLPAVKGVVLDLRDNRGGDDPKWVLDWFAPKAYLDLRIEIKKAAALDAAVLRDVVNIDDAWIAALARAPEGATVSRFIGCGTPDCSDTTQRPAHRILPVKTALLVGPSCTSACDHFARVWDENGLGPLVGESSGGALTVLRLDHPVLLRGRRLGAMRLALSVESSPFTSLPLEGLPLHVDVPVAWTWATRDTYDASLVDAAIASLAK